MGTFGTEDWPSVAPGGFAEWCRRRSPKGCPCGVSNREYLDYTRYASHDSHLLYVQLILV